MSVDPFELARSIRPQGFGGNAATRIAEPVVEPLWSGVRVIAAGRGRTAELLQDGEPFDTPAALSEAVAAAAATTDGVILDGYVTKQVANDEPGVYTGADTLPSTGSILVGGLVGLRRRARRDELREDLAEERAARDIGADEPVNLVVVDLLWLDGQWLLDVPLLERKRLLEAILPGGDLVRPSPYVRPPLASWVGSWRAQGFRGLAFKAANSRYKPGEKAKDWASTSMPRR
jgi:hypothetical protein